MRYLTPRRTLGIALVLLSSTVQAQSLRSDGALLDRPEGARVASLKSGVPAQVVKRQGFWAEIKAGGKSGWLRLNQLQFGNAGGLVALDTGRATADNIVSTSVARGLSAKDLLQGRPDRAAVAQLDAFVPDAASIDRFSAEGGFKTSAPVKLKRPAVALSQSQPKHRSGATSDEN